LLVAGDHAARHRRRLTLGDRDSLALSGLRRRAADRGLGPLPGPGR